jgi:RimJ/RimL family protein N-acetyltransferase
VHTPSPAAPPADLPPGAPSARQRARLAALAAEGRPLPTLETARLRLRPLGPADGPAFAALHADPEVMDPIGGPLAPAAAAALMERLQQGAARRGFGVWALQPRGGGPLLGLAGLWSPDWEAPFTPAVELVWRLARPAWGQGLATEAARAAVAEAFGPLGLDEVQAWTAVQNARSAAVMDRLGMRDLGEFDHPALDEGHPLRRHLRRGLRAGDGVPEVGARPRGAFPFSDF